MDASEDFGVPQLATDTNLQELLEATHPPVYSMTRDVTTANREDGDGEKETTG